MPSVGETIGETVNYAKEQQGTYVPPEMIHGILDCLQPKEIEYFRETCRDGSRVVEDYLREKEFRDAYHNPVVESSASELLNKWNRGEIFESRSLMEPDTVTRSFDFIFQEEGAKHGSTTTNQTSRIGTRVVNQLFGQPGEKGLQNRQRFEIFTRRLIEEERLFNLQTSDWAKSDDFDTFGAAAEAFLRNELVWHKENPEKSS